MVVDSDKWIAELPQSIEAVFFIECGSWDGSSGQGPLPQLAGGNLGQAHQDCASAEKYAREVHKNFISHYGSANAVPLLKLRLNNWEEPFVQVG